LIQRKISRIVVRRDDHLGDMVIALPVLKALRTNYPNAEFTLMVKESQRILCKTFADKFIDPVPLDLFPRIARKYDLAFNIDYFGPGNHEKQKLKRGVVNHINAVPGNRRRPMARHLMDGLAVFVPNISRELNPQFQIPRSVKVHVIEWLKEQSIKKKNSLWIGIHVGSRVKEKCWTPEKFTRLALWLHRSFGAQLFFFGAKHEEHTIRSIVEQLPEGVALNVLNQPLDFVAGVLSRMDFFIGNDSGVGHLASAVRRPTVSIFGPSSPVHWRPAGDKSIVVYRKTKIKKHDPARRGPILSVEEVKQGVLLCVQRHVTRDKFFPLDRLRLSRRIQIDRTSNGVIVRAGVRGPACLVTDGWRNVKRVLASIEKSNSYNETLRIFPDAGPLIDLFILHRIIRQGH
jgi:ADP-heptose:LPS heptosyltransferase